jgi:hypothetical protein
VLSVPALVCKPEWSSGSNPTSFEYKVFPKYLIFSFCRYLSRLCGCKGSLKFPVSSRGAAASGYLRIFLPLICIQKHRYSIKMAAESTSTVDMPPKPSHFKLVWSKSLVTDEVLHHQYKGSGTEDDPYAVDFIPHDPRNPMLFGGLKRWSITALLGLATLAVSFSSSVYSGGVEEIIEYFQCTQVEATLGVSLFVLGFAIGPLFWG